MHDREASHIQESEEFNQKLNKDEDDPKNPPMNARTRADRQT